LAASKTADGTNNGVLDACSDLSLLIELAGSDKHAEKKCDHKRVHDYKTSPKFNGEERFVYDI
jgi:hypothetical protein